MTATLTFFNLFANATFSFWMGILIVSFFIFLFRIKTGPWKLFLLMLPFVKVLFDFVNGVPKASVLLNHLDPFKALPQHQTLSIGFGASEWGPHLEVLLTVKDAVGKHFSASVGDYLFYWISDKNLELPKYILLVAVGISLLHVSRRLFKACQFELLRKKDRKRATPLKTLKADFRQVDIYISQAFTGTPFTGGILKPYICIPQETHKALSPDESAAVIAHELGHIRQFDIAFTVFIQFMGDIFWFIPAYRRLSQKIDRLREIVADQFAVRSGVRGEFLASALLKLKEIPSTSGKFILYSAFTREKSLLKIRIQSLLGEGTEQAPRFGWGRLWVRVVFSVFIVSAVINSKLVGNHSVKIWAPTGITKQIFDYFGFKPYQE